MVSARNPQYRPKNFSPRRSERIGSTPGLARNVTTNTGRAIIGTEIEIGMEL
jgi:hypothetical protein